MDFDAFAWTREPAACSADGDRLEVTTAPHADLWQRTYYHFTRGWSPSTVAR